MVHIPYFTTRILREIGLKADYLANETSLYWDKSDYVSPQSYYPFLKAVKEFYFFWNIFSRYEVAHLHFGHSMSQSGWELKYLNKMNRKIVIHYRGCEVRNYFENIKLHPKLNICQSCDYDRFCISKENVLKMKSASKFGNKFLVTTPDMLDFVNNGIHIPFFTPTDIDFNKEKVQKLYPSRSIRILHWTNHPGIEGSNRIVFAIELLRKKGYKIDFIFLKGVNRGQIIEEIFKADLTIGKMKMGYYANSQIEAMYCGIPTITWVRPELMTDELKNSGFIFSHLDDLENTIEYYLKHPNELLKKRSIARNSIQRLHDNKKIAYHYKKIYGF